MTTSVETKANETSLTADVIAYVRARLGGRRGIIILAGVALGTGLVFNWSWLVAAGIAPLLIALAPCALMCAAGLCMSKMGGGSCSSEEKASQDGAPTRAVDSDGPQLSQSQLQQDVEAVGREAPALAAFAPSKGKPNRKGQRGPRKPRAERREEHA